MKKFALIFSSLMIFSVAHAQVFVGDAITSLRPVKTGVRFVELLLEKTPVDKMQICYELGVLQHDATALRQLYKNAFDSKIPKFANSLETVSVEEFLAAELIEGEVVVSGPLYCGVNGLNPSTGNSEELGRTIKTIQSKLSKLDAGLGI